MPKQVCAFLGLKGCYRKCIRNFAQIAKHLYTINSSANIILVDTNPSQCFFKSQGISHQAPICTLSNPKKCYIVYTDTSDDACGAQLSQEHNGTEFQIAFFSHTCTDTQQKWSTTKQEAYGVYYVVMKRNYYLQGAEIIVCNDHKPLARFLNGKNANNKVNRWD